MLKFALSTIAVALISQNSFATTECHGTEPFWGATLTENNLKLNDPVVQKTKNTKITSVSPALGYVGEFIQVYSNRRGPVAVVQTTNKCSNGMSDEIYTQEVFIFNGKDTLYGCCGDVVPSEEAAQSVESTK